MSSPRSPITTIAYRRRPRSSQATGRTGKLVIEQALGRGYDVIGLARDPEKVTSASTRAAAAPTAASSAPLATTSHGTPQAIPVQKWKRLWA
ncbi:MAG: NAD(P)H-binding protein [Solirubrobacterales bacterium]|nr:NAD(P)H-binding protein [Solirubrobacterales bacterium]MBV9917148.1 NAD(P)H-binding protein [Solirubrobacterales bacterium]